MSDPIDIFCTTILQKVEGKELCLIRFINGYNKWLKDNHYDCEEATCDEIREYFGSSFQTINILGYDIKPEYISLFPSREMVEIALKH